MLRGELAHIHLSLPPTLVKLQEFYFSSSLSILFCFMEIDLMEIIPMIGQRTAAREKQLLG
jgi:hypothetical protein